MVPPSEHSVFIYYVNKDLISEKKPESLFGMVIPCGSYRTEEEARRACDEISVLTGAECTVFCRNRKPFPLNPSITKEALTYDYNAKSDLNTIRQSLANARKRKEEVQARLDQEVIERTDHESLSYFINTAYRLTANDNRVAEAEKLLRQAQQARSTNWDDLVSYVRLHPTVLDTWAQEAEQRFAERGEAPLFATIAKKLEAVRGELIAACSEC